MDRLISEKSVMEVIYGCDWFIDEEHAEVIKERIKAIPSAEPKTGFIPKSVIEDIKAEIKEEADVSMGSIGDGYYDALDIIDKHIGGAKMFEPQERSDKCSKCEYYINPDYTRCKECGAERSDKE